MTPSRIEFDLGITHNAKTLLLVYEASREQGQNWSIRQNPGGGWSELISGMTPGMMRRIAEAVAYAERDEPQSEPTVWLKPSEEPTELAEAIRDLLHQVDESTAKLGHQHLQWLPLTTAAAKVRRLLRIEEGKVKLA